LGTSVEQCDDGANNSDNKDCTSRCNTSFCGDGHVDTSGTFTELCDPGTGAGGNRATANADSAWCDFNCTLPVCGDNHQNTSAGETCDDGNTIATDACTNVCRLATCGDYVVHVGVETCDMGPTDTATCNGAGAGAASCAPPTCGDGYINAAAGEVCDNNNFGGQSCITKGFSGGGPLLCTGSCTTIDTTNCTP
jgi:cysteine-rich repeat protein